MLNGKFFIGFHTGPRLRLFIYLPLTCYLDNDVKMLCPCLYLNLGSVWLEKWKSGMKENCGRMENIVFPRVFGWRGEKVRGWKTLLFG